MLSSRRSQLPAARVALDHRAPPEPTAKQGKRAHLQRPVHNGLPYCTVTTPTMLLEIYRDDPAGDWYLQRVMD